MQVPLPLDEDFIGDSAASDDESEDESSVASWDFVDSDDEFYDRFKVEFPLDESCFVFLDYDAFWKWGRRKGWKVPEEFKMISITGAIDPQDDQYHKLMDLLRHDKRRWDFIYFDGVGQPSSPEFLSLLVATFGKTEKLHLSDCMVDDASYACLNSGLLMATGGIKNIEIWTSPYRPITRSQMSILSQGLSLTTILETLNLQCDLTTPGVVEYLIAGLEANTSLKYLQSRWSDYSPGTLPLVIAALSSHPNLCHLTLRTEELRHSEVQEALQTLLSRDDCKLENVELIRADSWNGSRRNDTTSSFNLGKFHNPNTPLKTLFLPRLAIDGSALCAMLPSCKHLVELDLHENNISDLEPLDCLLLGESCALERLTLDENPISIDSARIFAQKLPKMKVLRQLKLRSGPFLEGKEFLEEFLGYANQNTSMELLLVGARYIDVRALRPKLMYGPCLNRAGRRYLGPNPGSLPLNLLPLVFVRAREILYYDPSDSSSPKEPTARLDGLDATFWLLRENGTLLSHLH